VRHTPAFADEVWYNPMEQRIDLARCEGFDAVVHLAGENVGSGDGLLAFTGRWTDRKKHAIMESRRRGTQLLAQAFASVRDKPRVIVSASGAGYYGSRGEEVLDESAGKGTGFLSDVAEVWEREMAPAARAGIRVVNTRFGMVLSRDGGALGAWRMGRGEGGRRECVIACPRPPLRPNPAPTTPPTPPRLTSTFQCSMPSWSHGFSLRYLLWFFTATGGAEGAPPGAGAAAGAGSAMPRARDAKKQRKIVSIRWGSGD
jgi:hypothetical protein